MEKWRLIISGARPPLENMETDYRLWQSAAKKESPPTLRFYQWNPSAVSLGYNQDAEKVINTEFCKTSNIPVVKRPTGGSAIFHDAELTYSFCSNVDEHPSFTSPLGSYLAVCRGIVNGMKRTGIRLEVRGFSEGKEPSFTGRDCFSLSSRHDLVYGNSKVVGSAQRRNKNAFLQHGSILLAIRRDLWENIFIEEVDFSKIISLNELMEKKVPLNYLIEIMKEGFKDAFNVEFEEKEV
jgi:lipoyl(octanoyl) transferase